MKGKLWIHLRVIAVVAIYICGNEYAVSNRVEEVKICIPAVPSAVMVPNLTLTGCVLSIK